MTKHTRASRVGEYMRESERADELAASGKPEEALDILRKCKQQASEARDQDFRLFFEEEILSIEAPDPGRQIEMLGEAIGWGRKKGYPDNACLLWNLGVCFSLKGDENAAIVWFDKALEANPNDCHAMRDKGISLSKKGDVVKAIAWFDKALEANPGDAAVLRGRAVCYFNSGQREKAFEDISAAARIAPVEWRTDFRMICRALGKNFTEEWSKLGMAPAADPGKPEKAAANLTDLWAFIAYIRNAIKDQAEEYLRDKKTAQEKSKSFLAPVSRLDPTRSIFMILRKWNSYTPAVPSSEDERSVGGGYFIWHGGKGTVVDPGFDFLRNFDEAGCRLCDVDSIVLTHAHNDHTIDFETLCALLHQCIEQAREEKRPAKKIDVYLNNGAFMKFSGMLDLKNDDYIRRVRTLNPGSELTLAGGLKMRVLPAYHDEIVATNQAVGGLFVFELPGGVKRSVLITGDTGLFPLVKADGKTEPDIRGKEIWEEYGDFGAAAGERLDMMVVHIGSILEDEFNIELDNHSERKKACYKNHLGIIGTARLITRCRPRVAVVSEFGEEMRSFRTALVGALKEHVIDKSLAEMKADKPYPRVVPGDIPFIYDAAEHKFLCCGSLEWHDMDQIEYRESQEEHTVYYHAPGKLDGDKEQVKRHFERFAGHRSKEYDKSFYFVEDAMNL